MRRKVCTNNVIYKNGHLVWYRKRDGDRAMGPGKVIFQDGKVIFLRHGSQFIQISANRIVRKDKEFGREEKGSESQIVLSDKIDGIKKTALVEVDEADQLLPETDSADDTPNTTLSELSSPVEANINRSPSRVANTTQPHPILQENSVAITDESTRPR